MQLEAAIESLRAQIENIEGRGRRARSVLPFGIAAVDSRLPGGGLAVGALHEIAGGGNGAIDGAAVVESAVSAAGVSMVTAMAKSRAALPLRGLLERKAWPPG